MNKLLNYIAYGKGIGGLLLLAFSFLTAIYFSFAAKSILTESVPYLQQIADNVLPLKVENGVVVVPENTIKEINLVGNNSAESYPFVIDTTKDTIDTTGLPEGIYLSRSFIYTVSKTKTEAVKLSESFDLPRQDYTSFFHSCIPWIVICIALVGTVILYILFILLTLFYAFCSGLAAAINKRQLSFDVKMRLSAVVFLVVLLFSSLLDKVGLNLNLLLFFLLVVVLQIITVKKLPE